MRANPLIAEALRGLVGVGQAQLAYLNCLLLQAVVLLFWWPKRTLSEALVNENPPDTLLAVIIALGVTTAYYALRTGGEEVLVAEQQPLRGWVVATPLSLPRIFIGFLFGRILQTLQAIFLSLPLVLAAYSVGGGDWPSIGWCLLTILTQAVFYHLLGAVLYTIIGHFSLSMFLSLRVALVVVYAATLALLPEANHVVVAYELLSGESWLTTGPLPAHFSFFIAYAAASLIMATLLLALLARYRARFEQRTEVDNQG